MSDRKYGGRICEVIISDVRVCLILGRVVLKPFFRFSSGRSVMQPSRKTMFMILLGTPESLVCIDVPDGLEARKGVCKDPNPFVCGECN